MFTDLNATRTRDCLLCAVFRKLLNWPTFLCYFFLSIDFLNFHINGLGYILGDYSQTRLVTLESTLTMDFVQNTCTHKIITLTRGF
jgi:hypothetical protein